MTRRRTARIVNLLCATVAGCGTVYSFPEPMGGLTMHVTSLDDPGVAPLWLALLPLTLTDLTLSFTADVLLLPITIPYHAVQRRPEPIQPRRRPPADVTTAPVTTGATVATRRPPPPIEEAYVTTLREEESFVFLPDADDPDPRHVAGLEHLARAREGTPMGLVVEAHLAERRGDPTRAVALCERALEPDLGHPVPRLVRGWALLRLGRLVDAERDLMAASAECMDRLNRTWALIGLGRLAERRSDRAAAAGLYRRALDEGALVDARAEHAPHLADLRRRIATLAER